MKAAIDSGDMNKAAQLNVQLLLSCLMTPDGKRIPAGALPSVDDLLAAHDNPTLVEAIGTVKRHAVGSLEEAEKRLTRPG